MEVEARPQFTWIDLTDYMPPDSGLSDKDCLSEIIAIIEKRLGQPFTGFD